MPTLYEKRGRRYVVWGGYWDGHDTMRAGQFRLTYCYEDGARRYTYDVAPDTAGWVAAAEVAAVAMEDAMRKRAPATPREGAIPWTKKQRECIERFRAEMAELGGNLPDYWTHASAREIAQAGIDAVRNWRP